jgi:pimeloyl-ACP methyl ester carboxylesterase
VAGTLALLATARQSACADPAPADWPGLRARRLATARQSACADPAFVVCIGGYQDLFRCSLQWFSPRTSRQKHGKYPVQYYGKWILMLTALDAVEKPEDRIALELVLRTLLEQARPPKGTWKLTTQGERWYRMAVELNPNDAGLQKEIEQHLTPRFEALSVRDDLKSIRCPVFLVHGDRDELIPPTETLELQRRLTSAETHLLLTPLISHTHSIMSQLSTKERWTAFLRAGSFIHALAGVS